LSDAAAVAVFALSDGLLEEVAALRPSLATFWGVPGHEDAWDDFGPDGAAQLVSTLTGYRRRLESLSPPADARERLAALVMRDYIDVELARIEHGDHRLDLNHITSPFQQIRMVFDLMDTSTRDGWENVLRRLETIDRACTSYRAALEEGRQRGETAAVRQVDAAIKQGRVHAGERSYFSSLLASFAGAGLGDSALGERLERAVAHARRAYAELTDYLEQTYRPAARATDAIGEERYLRHARRFLGMDIDARETFVWGFEQVRTIQARMGEVARQITPGGDIDEAIRLLETDPARCANGPADLVRIMAERQARAVSELDGSHFDIPAPVRTVEVKLAPPGGPIGAYYTPPSEDFSRPGTIWYSPGERERLPLYTEVSTAYHEGFPGHHLQLGIQVSLRDRLSRFHRVATTDYQSGYCEGWALYAERLMEELGYYDKPDYLLGMLANQMMRACRVVLDIGAHCGFTAPKDAPFHAGERLDFERGVDVLMRFARSPRDNAASEMTRYLGWPGQAISYKVGERVVLDLRDELRRRRGARFDLKEFHAELLGTGAVALGSLRALLLGT
jgi:uncharacterized protein (DUF885 family)